MAGLTGAVEDPDVIAERRLDDRTRDLIAGGAARLNGEDLFSETTPEGMREATPMTFDLVRFAVAMAHPGLDLDWVADFALKYTGE